MDESLKIQTTVERRLNGQYDTEMAKWYTEVTCKGETLGMTFSKVNLGFKNIYNVETLPKKKKLRTNFPIHNFKPPPPSGDW
jgi:hypothetical protein